MLNCISTAVLFDTAETITSGRMNIMVYSYPYDQTVITNWSCEICDYFSCPLEIGGFSRKMTIVIPHSIPKVRLK